MAVEKFQKTEKEEKKRYESEENVRNYLGKCNSVNKRIEKAFMEEVKTFQPKKTLHLITLLQLYLEHPEVAENNLSIMKKKQSGEVTISPSNSSKKQK